MSLTYGFYNSINHDRVYDAEQMCAIFDGVINDGVFMGVGGAMVVYPTTGMSVKVSSGRAWFDRTWTLLDADYPLTLDTAEVSLNRIDAIVLEVNHNEDVRENSIKIVKGTPASNPQKPVLVNEDLVHQHALAYVTVNAGTLVLTKGMIQNVIGTAETPFVTSILETTNVSYLMDQWEDQFMKWFKDAQGTLDEDSAGHLLNKINELREYTDDRFEDVEEELDLIRKNLARIKIKVVTKESKTPITNLLITGLKDRDGNPCYTDEEGVAKGFSTEGSITLSITGYADIQDYSATYQVYKATSYEYTWEVTTVNFRSWTSSGTTKLSTNVLPDGLDVSVGGAGGGGGGGYSGYAGSGGGGGGYVQIKNAYPFTANNAIAYVIGSPGSGGSYQEHGTSGGSSTFGTVTASGGSRGLRGDNSASSPGSGGSGNGNGGTGGYWRSSAQQYGGADGGTTSSTVFSSFSETKLWGGGGGGGGMFTDDISGGTYNATSGGNGGSGGGKGGTAGNGSSNSSNPLSGTNGGGGGGAYSYYYRSSVYRTNGASGSPGYIAIRMRLKAS